MQLEFTVSVDFTASNGNINDPKSRHYVDHYCLNQYELAIKSVLEICEVDLHKNFCHFSINSAL